MRPQLSAFIEAHPDGWGHAEWLGLLTELGHNGVDVSDPGAIGAALEQERLAWELRRRAVPGLGPKRIDAVVERFGTLWNLKHAEPSDVAELKTIPGALASKLLAAVQ